MTIIVNYLLREELNENPNQPLKCGRTGKGLQRTSGCAECHEEVLGDRSPGARVDYANVILLRFSAKRGWKDGSRDSFRRSARADFFIESRIKETRLSEGVVK